MKLKYKILWIEDEFDSIERPKSQIQRYLEDDYGFECKDEDIVIKDYDAFEEEFIYEEHGRKRVKDSIKDFDLLLVDFTLGEEEQTGDKLIEVIREGIYSEILFYSSNLEAVKNTLSNSFIDGVFTSDRDHLEDKIKKLIQVTIKKTQDINNLRGLIMAEVAELDRIKKSILLKYNAKNLDDSRLKKYVKEDVFKKINDELADLNCIVNPECTHNDIDLEKLLNNFFYDSFKKSRTVFKVKKLDSKCNDVPFVHQDYYDSVVRKRNVFAHEEEKIREDGTRYLNYTDGTPLEFTEGHCIQIRKDIKRYKNLLEQIVNKLDE